MSRELNKKERLFAFEYMADEKMNPERAAIRAGYSASVARTKAYLWVSKSKQNPKPHIAEFVAELMRKWEKQLDFNAVMILKEIGKIAFSSIGRIAEAVDYDFSIEKLKNLSDDLRDSIAELRILEDKSMIIKLYSKTRCLELLGKRFGLWNEEEG